MENCKSMIVLSAAMTLDGKIGQRNNKVVLSSKSDKIRVHKLRSKFDAILVGKNTVEQDDPLLSVRHVKGKNPTRIILDSPIVATLEYRRSFFLGWSFFKNFE